MTKREMQETIETRCVHEWECLNQYIKAFGKDNNITVIERARWSELDNLYRDLFDESPRY